MKTVTFLGPTHVLVVDGKSIKRGDSDTVSDAVAARLKKHPRIEVQVSDPPSQATPPPGPLAPATATDDTKEEG